MSTTHTFFRKPLASAIRVTGEDATDFLQSQFSNDIASLEDGAVLHALLLNLKGRIEGDAHVRKLCDEEYLLISEETPASFIMERFAKYIIADDVELEELSGDQDAVAEMIEALVGDEGRQLSADEAEKLRIRRGVPKVLTDATVEDFPQECGPLADLVSCRKGCYLGQEIMAGIRKTGRVIRGLALVEADGELAAGTALMCEGKTVGELRSVFSENGKTIGIAMLKRKVIDAEGVMIGGPAGMLNVVIVRAL